MVSENGIRQEKLIKFTNRSRSLKKKQQRKEAKKNKKKNIKSITTAVTVHMTQNHLWKAHTGLMI